MAVGTAQRSTNTMDEFNRKMLHTISDAKAAPDIDDAVDLPFLVSLETMILQFIRQPLEEAGVPTGEGSPMAPDAGMGMGGPPPGMPMGEMPMGPPPGAGIPGGGGAPPGMAPGIPTENMVSELRRSIG